MGLIVTVKVGITIFPPWLGLGLSNELALRPSGFKSGAVFVVGEVKLTDLKKVKGDPGGCKGGGAIYLPTPVDFQTLPFGLRNFLALEQHQSLLLLLWKKNAERKF